MDKELVETLSKLIDEKLKPIQETINSIETTITSMDNEFDVDEVRNYFEDIKKSLNALEIVISKK